MELKKKEPEASVNIFNKNERFLQSDTNQNRKFLYPNGHRMTHQMRWFKGSRDRGLKIDIAA